MDKTKKKRLKRYISWGAVAALVALGYKPQEASRMVSKIARPDASSETLIREALRAAL